MVFVESKMMITFYFRNVIGGIQTHVLSLKREFEKLGHDVSIIDQNVLLSKMIGDFYGIEIKPKEVLNLSKDADILHIHHGSTLSEFFIPFVKTSNIPIVNTFHIPVSSDAFDPARIPITLLARLYSARSRAFISVSNRVASILQNYCKTFVIPNGVDTEKFHPDDRKCRTLIKIGFLGRLSKEKNIFSLIRAIKYIDGVELRIAGRGPLYHKIKELEDEKVKVLGFVDDAAEFLRSLDIFVLPSFREAQPITILEAMASGLPIVATDVGDNRYFVTEEGRYRNGVLCRTDPEDIKRAINKVIEDDIELLGKNSRKRVEREFTWENIARKTLEVYRFAINRSM